MNIFQNWHTFIDLAQKEALTPFVSGHCPLDRVPFSGCGLHVNKNFVKCEIDSDSRNVFISILLCKSSPSIADRNFCQGSVRPRKKTKRRKRRKRTKQTKQRRGKRRKQTKVSKNRW